MRNLHKPKYINIKGNRKISSDNFYHIRMYMSTSLICQKYFQYFAMHYFEKVENCLIEVEKGIDLD